MALTPEQAQRILDQRAMTHSPQPRAPQGPDMRGLAQQMAQGLLASFSDEMIGVMGGVRAAIDGQGFEKGFTETRDNERALQNQFREDNPGTALASNILGGLLTGGAVFGGLKAAGASTGAAAPATPALEGAIAGAGASDAPLGTQTLVDAGQGALTGAALGAVGKAGTRFFGGRALGDVAEATADDLGRTAAQRADKLGITLTLGEELGDSARKTGDSALNALAVTRGVMRGRDSANQKAINRAVLKRFGFQGDKVTGRMLSKIEDKANSLYDQFARKLGNARFRRTDEFRAAMGDAVLSLKAADMNPALKTQVQKIARIVNGNRMNPKQIKRRLGVVRDLARKARSADKQDLADGYDALQDALFQAMDPGSSADAKQALDTASKYWRDMKVIDSENALEAISGNIKPGGLSSMLGRSRFTRDAFVRNAEPDNEILELGRLARQIGEDPGSLVGQFRSSKTSERNILNQLSGVAASPALVPAALGNSTRTGQRLATQFGRGLTTSGARAGGAEVNR